MQSGTYQTLDPARTTWHITWGTYGTRLHGGVAPTVDRQHNRLGTPFLGPDPFREQVESRLMNFTATYFTDEQRKHIEDRIPQLCERGGWGYRIAAAEVDHVHVLCDIVPEVHGEKVRRLMKRWLGQELFNRWELEKGASWWAEEGSNRAVKDRRYLNNVYQYIIRQRFTKLQ